MGDKSQWVEAGGMLLNLDRVSHVTVPREDRPGRPVRVTMADGTVHELSGDEAKDFIESLKGAVDVRQPKKKGEEEKRQPGQLTPEAQASKDAEDRKAAIARHGQPAVPSQQAAAEQVSTANQPTPEANKAEAGKADANKPSGEKDQPAAQPGLKEMGQPGQPAPSSPPSSPPSGGKGKQGK